MALKKDREQESCHLHLWPIRVDCSPSYFIGLVLFLEIHGYLEKLDPGVLSQVLLRRRVALFWPVSVDARL